MPQHAETVFFGTGSIGGSARLGASQPPAAPQQKRWFLERAEDGSRYELDPARPIVVGRSATSDIMLSGNAGLSRHHVRIEYAGDGFDITDLHALNGTVVAGVRLDPGQTMRVRPGEPFSLAGEDVAIVAE